MCRPNSLKGYGFRVDLLFLFYCLLFRSPITDLDWKGTGLPVCAAPIPSKGMVLGWIYCFYSIAYCFVLQSQTSTGKVQAYP